MDSIVERMFRNFNEISLAIADVIADIGLDSDNPKIVTTTNVHEETVQFPLQYYLEGKHASANNWIVDCPSYDIDDPQHDARLKEWFGCDHLLNDGLTYQRAPYFVVTTDDEVFQVPRAIDYASLLNSDTIEVDLSSQEMTDLINCYDVEITGIDLDLGDINRVRRSVAKASEVLGVTELTSQWSVTKTLTQQLEDADELRDDTGRRLLRKHNDRWYVDFAPQNGEEWKWIESLVEMKDLPLGFSYLFFVTEFEYHASDYRRFVSEFDSADAFEYYFKVQAPIDGDSVKAPFFAFVISGIESEFEPEVDPHMEEGIANAQSIIAEVKQRKWTKVPNTKRSRIWRSDNGIVVFYRDIFVLVWMDGRGMIVGQDEDYHPLFAIDGTNVNAINRDTADFSQLLKRSRTVHQVFNNFDLREFLLYKIYWSLV